MLCLMAYAMIKIAITNRLSINEHLLFNDKHLEDFFDISQNLNEFNYSHVIDQ